MPDLLVTQSGTMTRNRAFVVEDIDGNQRQIALGTFSIDSERNVNFNISIERYDVIKKTMEQFQKEINDFILQCQQDCVYGKMPFIYKFIDQDKLAKEQELVKKSRQKDAHTQTVETATDNGHTEV